jgi:hypothetical protein
MEQIAGVLDRFGTLLVFGWGLLYFLMAAGPAYTLQSISDKTDAAPSWMAWVPFVQLHPMIRASGTSWAAVLAWFVGLVAAIVVSALLSSAGATGAGTLLTVVATIGSLVCFAGMMARLAERRGCSVWVGVACLVPLLGLPFYAYIAFHDGLVRPSRVGLALTAVLAALVAWSFESDLSEARTMLGAFEAQQGMFGTNGPERPEQAQAMFESIEQLLRQGTPPEMPPEPAADAGSDGDADGGLLSALTSWARRASKPRPAYPEDIEVPRRLECEPGTRPRGEAPPAGREAWCESDTTGVRQGWYLAWHPNGRLERAGRYVEGRRQGTWVRFWKTGGRRAQANFENDEEHGILVLWDPLGRVEREIPFVHGEPG